VGELLRSLPRALRRELQPIEPKVTEIVSNLQPSGDSLCADLGRFLHHRYGVTVPPNAWRTDAVPAHLRPRVEVVDAKRKSLAAGRDLEQLRAQLKEVKTAPSTDGNEAWQRTAAKWERPAVSGWVFGDLPERITVSGEPLTPPLSPSDGERVAEGRVRGDSDTSAPAVFAWPGLALEGQDVSVRLFRSAELAREASLQGVARLVELAIQKDLAWLHRDLRVLAQLSPLYAPLGSSEDLQEAAYEHLKRHVLPAAPLPKLAQTAFANAVTESRERLRGLPTQLVDRLRTILQVRQQIAAKLGNTVTPIAARPQRLTQLSQLGQPAALAARHPLAGELDALLPADFLKRIPFERLAQMPRYLKALLIRIERAVLKPAKDQERAAQLAPYQLAVQQLTATPPKSLGGRRAAEEFRWLVEEFKVSLFAQELGTAVPVSPKRLDQHLERVRGEG